MIPSLRESNGSVSFQVRVVPRANKSEIVGVEGDSLKVRLKAPPVEGKANEALVKFIAERLAVSKSQVEILSGHASRTKVVRVRGIQADHLQTLIPH